jgi:putative transposase
MLALLIIAAMRSPRIDYPGAFHHVMSRGNGKQDIFLTDSDRQVFLTILSSVVAECSWICHSYCLMGNHFHLLIETPAGGLAEGMQRLNGTYGTKFNTRHSRIGHVMQGRYTARLIKDDDDFLVVARYAALNPVKAKFVSDPQEWRWSSYRASTGLSPIPSFLQTELTLALFSPDATNARREFRTFVLAALEDAAAGELDHRPSLAALFSSPGAGPENTPVMIDAHHHFGYSMLEIADFLGVSNATVCRRIKAAIK